MRHLKVDPLLENYPSSHSCIKLFVLRGLVQHLMALLQGVPPVGVWRADGADHSPGHSRIVFTVLCGSSREFIASIPASAVVQPQCSLACVHRPSPWQVGRVTVAHKAVKAPIGNDLIATHDVTTPHTWTFRMGPRYGRQDGLSAPGIEDSGCGMCRGRLNKPPLPLPLR